MTIKFLGITDEVTVCDKCGRQHLKRTVALDIDGVIAHYGCDCAARALWKGKKEIASQTRSLNYYGEIIGYINGWIAKGHSLEVCLKGQRNKWNFPCELKNGKLTVRFSDTLTQVWG